MRTATEALRSSPRPPRPARDRSTVEALLASVTGWLDDGKAEDIVTIDLAGKSSIADFMIIATGTSERHVSALAEQVQRKLKEQGHGRVRIEGQQSCDWVLLDAGDIIVHVFRPEVRAFYNLEKMWSAERLPDPSTH